MPPALDRLLASPSALRLLRSIVNASEFPATCSARSSCCDAVITRRNHSTERVEYPKLKWRRWHETADKVVNRDQVRRLLEADGTNDSPGLEDKWEDSLFSTQGGKGDEESRAKTLAHQERLRRLPGIKSVWRDWYRKGYHLPTHDTPDAEYLWGNFIKHPQLVKDVIHHAAELLQETGTTYPRLYDLIMIYWLPRRPYEALEHHHQMLVTLKLRKLPLRDLARSGRSTFTPGAYEALMDMYRNSNERDVYDEVVPVLVGKGNITLARRWHSLCMFRNDLPSEAVAAHPVIHIFTAESSTIMNTDLHFQTKTTSKSLGIPKGEHGKYNEELMRKLLGRDSAPVRFEDSFCARMFATRTFPPASIIQGLALVGVNEIGPQAVLAMALRTQPIEHLHSRFEELRAAGIAVQGCVFSLALEKFALEHKWQLVRSMLDSDQHPDVFGSAEMQRSLLEYYLDHEDFVQVQRTLAILTLFHNDSSAESWNLLLQVYIKRSGPQHVMELLQDMRIRNVMLTLDSVLAIKSLLRQRQRGRKPVTRPQIKFDDLRFVTRVYISILESGMGAVSPHAWREIIRRFGMLGRFREMKRLLLWLLCWYAPRSSIQFTDLPKSPFLDAAVARQRAAHPERAHYFHFPAMTTQHANPKHPIRQLFTPVLQHALIVWGFRAGVLPNAHLEQSMFGATLVKKHYRQKLLQDQVLTRLDWSVGLRTVTQLRDLGVYVHYHTVLKALQAQFVVMFGRGRSNRGENRVLEQTNTKSYTEYVREVNEIWGSQLLVEPAELGKSALYDYAWHPRRRRKTNRKATVSLKEVMGPHWQQPDSKLDLEVTRKSKAGSNDIAGLEELQKHFAAQAKAKDIDVFSQGDLQSRTGT